MPRRTRFPWNSANANAAHTCHTLPHCIHTSLYRRILHIPCYPPSYLCLFLLRRPLNLNGPHPPACLPLTGQEMSGGQSQWCWYRCRRRREGGVSSQKRRIRRFGVVMQRDEARYGFTPLHKVRLASARCLGYGGRRRRESGVCGFGIVHPSTFGPSRTL